MSTDVSTDIVRLMTGEPPVTVRDVTTAQGVDFRFFGAVGDYDPVTGALGSSNSAAWASALAWCAANRATLFIPEGHYRIPTAPGAVLDAADHDCPEIDYDWISIRGVAGKTFLYSAFGASSRPRANTSKPILKAASTSGGTFRIAGVTLDGRCRTLGDSKVDNEGGVGNGNHPDSASLLEISGCDEVFIDDLAVSGFIQNQDVRADKAIKGYYMRRGPLFVHDNNIVSAKGLSLFSPSFREGPFFCNNTHTEIEQFSYVGPAALDEVNGGHVSSPLNVTSTRGPLNVPSGEDPLIRGGTILIIRNPKFRGMWGGSCINGYVPGYVDIYEPSIVTLGLLPGGRGKGIDFGKELARVPYQATETPIGGTKRITIHGGVLKDCYYYSLLFNRDDEATKIDDLILKDVHVDGGWIGLSTEFVDGLWGRARIDGIMALDPNDSRMGVGAMLRGPKRGDFRFVGDGSRSMDYSDPAASPAILPGTKRSRTAVQCVMPGASFNLTAETTDWNVAHIDFPITSAVDDIYTVCLKAICKTDLYPAPTSGAVVRIGSSGAGRVKRAYIDPSSTLNDDLLLYSDKFEMHSAELCRGLSRLVLGRPETSLGANTPLADLLIWNGDRSSGAQKHVVANADDANGRGGSISIWTAQGANAMVERIKITGGGRLKFVTLPPIFANDAAAGADLTQGEVWRTSGGALMMKL